MDMIYDEDLITIEDLEGIISSNFNTGDNDWNERGAGSFCKFVNYKGKSYALLTKRAENLLFNGLRNVMNIINKRDLPVAIVGAGKGIKREDDYMIILPKIEGLNLPSYVYGISRNLTLASASQSISQRAMNTLANECRFLNTEAIAIDFHGANFIWQEENDAIRLIDLKKRGQMNEIVLFKKFIRLTAVNKLEQFKDKKLVDRIKAERGIDIDDITMKNVVKSYIALLSTGARESEIAAALKSLFGQDADIDKISGKI